MAENADAAAANLGGGTKLRSLLKTEPNEWITWRNHFLVVAQVRGWNELRQRQEIVAAMAGPAAEATQHIDWQADGLTPAGLLDLYEGIFVTPAGQAIARQQFRHIAQMTDETLLEFHSRCRASYRRAFPADQQWAESIALKEGFIFGLADQAMAQVVADAAPATFQAALAVAQNRMASQMTLASRFGHKKGGMNAMASGEDGKDAVNAMHNPNVLCYHCGQRGHIRRNCPNQAAPFQGRGRAPRRGSPAGGRGRAGGQRGNHRSRGKGRGRGRGRGRPVHFGGLNSMEEEDDTSFDDQNGPKAKKAKVANEGVSSMDYHDDEDMGEEDNAFYYEKN